MSDETNPSPVLSPGFERASAMSSFAFLTGTRFDTASIIGAFPSMETAAKLVFGSNGFIFEIM